MDKQWLSTGEIARRVGFSERWVLRQIECGRLRATAFTPGRKVTYRIRLADFEAFRAACFRETGGGAE